MSTSIHNRTQKWVHIALLNLSVAALAGLFLRILLVFPVPNSNFQYFLHAHSHFAFSGWGFMAIFIAFYHTFIPTQAKAHKHYTPLFILGLIAAYGMLFSFPFQGYALVSISFSTLFILVSYWFGWRFFKDTGSSEKYGISILFARAAIFFLVISSIGPFAMGPIMAKGGSGTPLYHNAIYFYLHFQYNGWFIFGLLALFFRWMEQQNINYEKKFARWFYRLMLWSSLPTFLLSTLWANPDPVIYYIAGIGAALQLAAIAPLWFSLRKCFSALIAALHPANKLIGMAVSVIFLLKLLLQFFSSFPQVVEWTVNARPLVIGYLHLVLLGIFTLFLLAWFIQQGFMVLNKLTYYGLLCFLTGIFLTEVLLFAESFMLIIGRYISGFNEWMFILSILLPVGTGLLFLGNLSGRYFINGIPPLLGKRELR